MGYKQIEVTVTGRLSDHNSDQDDADRETWERFVTQVRQLAEQPEFADLILNIDG